MANLGFYLSTGVDVENLLELLDRPFYHHVFENLPLEVQLESILEAFQIVDSPEDDNDVLLTFLLYRNLNEIINEKIIEEEVFHLKIKEAIDGYRISKDTQLKEIITTWITNYRLICYKLLLSLSGLDSCIRIYLNFNEHKQDEYLIQYLEYLDQVLKSLHSTYVFLKKYDPDNYSFLASLIFVDFTMQDLPSKKTGLKSNICSNAVFFPIVLRGEATKKLDEIRNQA